MSPNAAQRAAREARTSTPARVAARAGFAVNGLVHVIIGALAIAVSLGSGAQADQSGAFSQIASTPGGTAVLWLVVLALASLGMWLIAGVVLQGRPHDRRQTARLVAESGKGVAYLALAAIALPFALGRGRGGSGGAGWTAQLLAAPGGVVLLAVLGAGVIAIGGYFVVKGVRRRFIEDIGVPKSRVGTAVVVLGVLGYVAKGLALCTVGVLLVVAAVTTNPSQAQGLDAALKSLVTLPAGAALLFGVGAGLIAYGVYSGVRARLAKL